MSLELKPGDLLSETELSKVLNLSRTPIREVIMKLNYFMWVNLLEKGELPYKDFIK